MTKINYGHAAKCVNCGQMFTTLYNDSFFPTKCLNCGGTFRGLNKKESQKLEEEINEWKNESTK